jgi:hypothetical protein
MNTLTHSQSLSTSFAKRVATLVSPETRRLVNLGRQQGWDCAVLGNAPLPSAPVRLGEWLIVPAHQDSSEVPARALERVQAIYAAGLRPQGFVVVHEAPLLLSAPKPNTPHTWRMPVLSPQVQSVLKAAAGVLGTLAVGLVAIAGVVAVAALMVAVVSIAAILVFPIFAMGAVMLDPILVAITEDGYWVEIDRWWN